MPTLAQLKISVLLVTPQNSTAKSLLLTRSLTDNINGRLTNTLYDMCYLLYSNNREAREKILLKS